MVLEEKFPEKAEQAKSVEPNKVSPEEGCVWNEEKCLYSSHKHSLSIELKRFTCPIFCSHYKDSLKLKS